ncbi:hypothetical protein [Deinococcus fonticola]|uniref:hypothetical protein n=1 Tax=Deinococcus fonticola TaxID=2528713 RepID=UPI001074D80E|nr:hypothetical protein [Deinococcus fonticola]
MNSNPSIENTAIGKIAGRMGLKFNLYYAFLILLNAFVLMLCFWDVKGVVLLILSLGFTMHVRLLLTQREEQRLTNELLEELTMKAR